MIVPASIAPSMTVSSVPGLGSKDHGLVGTEMICDLPSLPLRLQEGRWAGAMPGGGSTVEGKAPTKSGSAWSTTASPLFSDLEYPRIEKPGSSLARMSATDLV